MTYPPNSGPKLKSGRYRHFKGKLYELVAEARHSETEEPLVIYRPLYGERDLWVRPRPLFLAPTTTGNTRFAFEDDAPAPTEPVGPFRTAETRPEDEYFMALALRQAERAAALGEVPVGAVLTAAGAVLAHAHNAPIGNCDPTAHAEVQVLRRAAALCGNYRLPATTLYVTLEPCTMCVGALVHARVGRLVFAAAESKAGAVVSHPLPACFNHQVAVTHGIHASEAKNLLQEFFRSRRR